MIWTQLREAKKKEGLAKRDAHFKLKKDEPRNNTERQRNATVVHSTISAV